MRADRLRRFGRYVIALLCHYSGLDALYRRIAGGGVVILMFHRVRDDRDVLPLTITPASFWRIVDWLRDEDLDRDIEVALDELDRGELSGVRYVITFDDGYCDNLELISRGKPPPAIVYLATGAIGAATIWPYRLANAIADRRVRAVDLRDLSLGEYDLDHDTAAEALLLHLNDQMKRLPVDALEATVDRIVERLDPTADPANPGDMLSWENVADMADAGIDIGSQTISHAIVARLPDDAARHEIEGSKQMIDERLGPAPRHFAYPNGTTDDFGDRDVALVRAAGYRTATTTVEGVNRRGADRFRLLRHNVHETRFRSPFGNLSRALFFSETSGVLGGLRSLRNG
jgi:peptidoglycan/xylan/chitin deacetylase (PgdA/CDA1 family)